MLQIFLSLTLLLISSKGYRARTVRRIKRRSQEGCVRRAVLHRATLAAPNGWRWNSSVSAPAQGTRSWAWDRQDRPLHLFLSNYASAALKRNTGLQPSKIKTATLEVLERRTLCKARARPVTDNATFHSLSVFQAWVCKHIHCTSFYYLTTLRAVFTLFYCIWRKRDGTHSSREIDLKKNNPNYNFEYFLLESRTVLYLPIQNWADLLCNINKK